MIGKSKFHLNTLSVLASWKRATKVWTSNTGKRINFGGRREMFVVCSLAGSRFDGRHVRRFGWHLRR